MSDFRPDVFAVSPFQKVEIKIGDFTVPIDRSRGEFFNQYEGNGIYVEQCDYPALISLVNLQDVIQTATPLKEGLKLKGPFKGFYLTHPPINVFSRLQLVLEKNCSDHSNSFNTQLTRFGVSSRNTVSSATASNSYIYVPPGARALRGLQMQVFGSTTIAAVSTGPTFGTAPINAPSNLTRVISGSLITYGTVAPMLTYGPVSSLVIGTTTIFNFPDYIPVPSACDEFNINIAGTGLGTVQFTGYWE